MECKNCIIKAVCKTQKGNYACEAAITTIIDWIRETAYKCECLIGNDCSSYGIFKLEKELISDLETRINTEVYK